MSDINYYRPPAASLVVSNTPAPDRHINPFAPAHLADLFLAPSRFFAPGTHIAPRWTGLLAIWLLGIVSVGDRIDTRLVRADLGGSPTVAAAITQSWGPYWALLLLGGVLAGGLAWLVGGWWYRVRLRWAGALDPDPGEARRAYVFSGLVVALPYLLYTLYLTLRFDSYAAAWEDQGLEALLLLGFLPWSCITSYCAVKARFGVRGVAPALLFLLLPLAIYLAALSVLATAYFRLGS